MKKLLRFADTHPELLAALLLTTSGILWIWVAYH